MNRSETIERRAVDLLAEFRDICDANGLNYYLAPKTLIRAVFFGDLEENFVMPVVLMPVQDALAFVELIRRNKPEGRSLDYMKTNPGYRSFSIDYVDDTTTYIQLNRGTDFCRHGIKVTIDMIRDDVKNKMSALLETGWEHNAYNHPRNPSGKVVFVRNMVKGLEAIDGNLASRLFDRFAGIYTGNRNSEEVFVRSYLQERKYLPRKAFASTATIKLYEESFKIPADIDAYLQTFYNEGWQNVELAKISPRRVISSCNIPFEEAVRQLEKAGTPIEDLFRGYVEEQDDLAESGEVVRSRGRAFLVAKRSGDRLHIYEELHPKIEKIRALREKREYDALKEIFRNYDEMARYYLKRDLALCPDEELMLIECELLRRQGRSDLADKMIALVPEAHRKPLGARS